MYNMAFIEIAPKIGFPAAFLIIVIVASFFGLIDSPTRMWIAIGVSLIAFLLLMLRFGFSINNLVFSGLVAIITGSVLRAVLECVSQTAIA